MQQKGRGRLAKSAALDRVTGKMPESVAFERGAQTVAPTGPNLCVYLRLIDCVRQQL